MKHPAHHAECGCNVCAGKARAFTAPDWIGKTLMCPHCGKLLDITAADGPHEGYDPSEGMRRDSYWFVTLSDGTVARMWEDRKCILLNPDGTDRKQSYTRGQAWGE